MKIRTIIFFGVIIPSLSSAQTMETRDSTDQIAPEIESVLGEETEDADDSQRVDLLNELHEHPIDLNEATSEELSQLPGFHDLLVSRILERRNQARFKAVRELMEVEGITGSLYRVVRPYLMVGPGGRTSGLPVVETRARLIAPIKRSRGNQERAYDGSPMKVYQRLRVGVPIRFGGHRGIVRMHGLTEKDAGERMGNFASGFVEGSVEEFRMILGDYGIESSTGLLFPRKYISAVADIFGPARIGSGLRGYSSTDENFFFRGLAAQIKMSRIGVQLFVSNKPVNATVDSAGLLTSLDRSGLFRTPGERDRKGSARERIYGGLVLMSIDQQWRAGAKYFTSEFDHEPSLGGRPSPRRSSSFGCDLRFLGQGWMIFVEAAVNRSGSSAVTGGIHYALDKSLDVHVSAHSRSKSFQNIYHVSFDANESDGLYAGVDIRLSPDLKVRGSANRGFEGWNNSVSSFPLASSVFYVGLEMGLNPIAEALIEVKGKEAAVSNAPGSGFRDERTQRSMRVTLTTHASRLFRTQTRLEWGSVIYHAWSEHAVLMFQDVQWSLGRWSIDGRMVLFETGSYDSRLYEYEHDLPGTFATPALYGRGSRSYLMVSRNMSEHIVLGAKYSRTMRDGARSIGTGLDQIPGDVVDAIAVQMDVRL